MLYYYCVFLSVHKGTTCSFEPNERTFEVSFPASTVNTNKADLKLCGPFDSSLISPCLADNVDSQFNDTGSQTAQKTVILKALHIKANSLLNRSFNLKLLLMLTDHLSI